jgi:hypothetical protein
VHPPSLYDEIVVTAVGDVMLGTTFPDESALPPNDGADLLTEVTPFLKRGDVVYGNLEGPIVDGGTSAKCQGKAVGRCFAFRVPTRYGKYLKEAGLTAMGLANNHAMDFGLDGRASSRQVLDAMQIAHTGEVGDIARLTVKGRKVAIIAFATYPGAYNFLDLEESMQAIRSLKAESDLVIVGFHGGAEGATHQHVLEGDETFLGEDRGDLRREADAPGRRRAAQVGDERFGTDGVGDTHAAQGVRLRKRLADDDVARRGGLRLDGEFRVGVVDVRLVDPGDRRFGDAVEETLERVTLQDRAGGRRLLGMLRTTVAQRPNAHAR